MLTTEEKKAWYERFLKDLEVNLIKAKVNHRVFQSEALVKNSDQNNAAVTQAKAQVMLLEKQLEKATEMFKEEFPEKES